jgi:hypothetical protein
MFNKKCNKMENINEENYNNIKKNMNFEKKLWKILESKNNELLKELFRLIYLYNYIMYMKDKEIDLNFIIK